MADDISNKTLAALLAVAVVVSLGGTLIVLKSGSFVTGLASTDVDTGTAQVDIASQAAISVPGSFINFTNGFVFPNSTACTLDSGVNAAGTACPLNGSWGAISDGTNSDFLVRNDGNIDLNITMYGGANTWIGGTSPAYNFQSNSSTTDNGCRGGYVTAWTAVPTVGPGPEICSNLSFGASANQMEIDLQITIPVDAPPGQKTDTVTFTGTSL